LLLDFIQPFPSHSSFKARLLYQNIAVRENREAASAVAAFISSAKEENCW